MLHWVDADDGVAVLPLLFVVVDTWKTGERYRTLSREEARALMPMYDYEPSLSLDHEGRTSSIDDALSSLGFSPDTPLSVSSSHGFGENAMVLVSAEGVVQVQDDREEEKAPPPAYDEAYELPPRHERCYPPPTPARDQVRVHRAVYANVQRPLTVLFVCLASTGINLRAQSPTYSDQSTPRHAQTFDAGRIAIGLCTFLGGADCLCLLLWVWPDPPQPCIEDYLCTCKSCPRAMMIQRAFKLYSFALDHPESDALLRVLRACANYDETIIEMDPLLVLHAEKMLQQLGFDEDQAFRLLIASHFQRP